MPHPARPTVARAATAAVVALVAGVASACSAATAVVSVPDLRPVQDFEYVAMGDSYAAAPGVPETSGTDACFRSDHNYAHLLTATDDSIRLVDVTCSGADTTDVLESQVGALGADTDLVTIGIGGNDEDLFTGLVLGCIQAGAGDPQGAPCTEVGAPRAAEVLPGIEDDIGTTFDTIAERAPDARVVVVGYPDLLPDEGTCPDRLSLAAGDYAFVKRLTLQLTRALERQASERGFDYVDLYTASKGHDICSDDPWINGAETAPDGTIPFHPFASEQAAVAELIRDLFRG